MAMIGQLLKQLLRKPATLKYPFEKRKLYEGFRGKPVWDLGKCIGCGLCVRDCPSEALEMIGKGPKAEIIHHLDRCLFCGRCAESCPRGAITMTTDYELADSTKEKMVTRFKREG